MDNLQDSFRMIENLLNVHISFLHTEDDIHKFANRYRFTQLQKSFQPEELQPLFGTMQHKTICEVTDRFEVYCCYLRLGKEIVAIGPYCTVELGTAHITAILADSGIPAEQADTFLMYRSTFPTLLSSKIGTAARTLLTNLDGSGFAADMEHIRLDSSEQTLMDESMEPAFAEGRKKHIDLVDVRYATEQKLMDAISAGNASEAIFHLQDINRSTAQLRYISYTLENAKVGAAISRTIMRIAAARSAVSPIELDTLATEYARKVDKARTIEAVNHMLEQTVIDFCALVQQAQNNRYSPIVRKALEYISINLALPIQVQEIATELNVTPNYLSAVFKRETGDTISHYVQKRRVEKAAQMLLYSSMSIQGISTCVGFMDCNYFTKIFRQEYGVAPTQYRREFGYLSS